MAGSSTAGSRKARHPEDSDTSEDDTYFDDFMDRPGTGIIDEKLAGKQPAAVLSGDEAMWIAWYLCWYAKQCDAAPPERMPRTHEFDTVSTPLPQEEQHRTSRPATIMAPTMDFEARFGHLRQDKVPTRSILAKSKAKWHKRALAFVGMEENDKQTRKLSLSGQFVSGKAIATAGTLNAFASGGFSPNTVKSAQGFAANFSRDVSRAARESTSPVQSMTVKGQGPDSPLTAQSGRSASPHRPKSRQLPPERWESLALGSDLHDRSECVDMISKLQHCSTRR